MILSRPAILARGFAAGDSVLQGYAIAYCEARDLRAESYDCAGGFVAEDLIFFGDGGGTDGAGVQEV